MRRVLEVFVLVGVLVASAVIIGTLILVTGLVQLIVGIANDPNAGPYRQVR